LTASRRSSTSLKNRRRKPCASSRSGFSPIERKSWWTSDRHGKDHRGKRPPRTCARLPSAILQRSEEHTSELQSLAYLVCRLLLDTTTSELYTLSLHDALPIFDGKSPVEYLTEESQKEAVRKFAKRFLADRAQKLVDIGQAWQRSSR